MMTLRTITLLLCVPMLASAQWVQTNGPYGGDVWAIASDGMTILSGTDGGGIFRSTDDGSNWTSVNSPAYIRTLLVEGSEIFAGTNGSGIYLSTDNGTNWVGRNTGLGPYYTITFMSKTGSVLLAGSYGGGVYRSTNNGSTWSTSNAGLDSTGYVYICSFVSKSPYVFISGNNGIFRSTDSGLSWVRAQGGLPTVRSAWLVASDTTLYAGIAGGENFDSSGVFRSEDDGTTWVKISPGLPSRHSTSGLVVMPDGAGGRVIVAGIYDMTGGLGISAVYRSTDDGASWAAVTTGAPAGSVRSFALHGSSILAATSSGMYVSDDRGAVWSRRISGIINTYVSGLAISGSELVASAGLFYQTSDRGEIWVAADTSALVSKDVTNLVSDGTYLFAGTSGWGVYFSQDAGRTWDPVNAGLTGSSLNIRDLAVSRNELGGTSVYAGTAEGAYVSSNFGASWTSIDAGLPERYVSAITSVPDGSGGNALLRGSGSIAHRSTDGGLTWNLLNVGMSSTEAAVAFTALSQASGQTSLFVGTADYTSGMCTGGVYRSTDNGSHWMKLNLGCSNVRGFATSGQLLFVAINSSFIRYSTDHGDTWTNAYGGWTGGGATALVVQDGYLMAGTDRSGVYAVSLNALLPPATPQGFVVTDSSSGQIALAWQKHTDPDILNYRIEGGSYPGSYSIVLTTLPGSGDTTITVTGLWNNWRHYFRIQAVDSAGNYSPYSEIVSAVPADRTPPSVPLGLTVVDSSSGTITLRWRKNPDADFMRYRLYGATSPNPTALVDSAMGGSADTSKRIEGLTNGTRYYFRVTAVDSAHNEGRFSNEVSAAPVAAPLITSFSPTSGPAGSAITITGTNFEALDPNNFVSFGGVNGTITSVTSTSMTVLVPTGAVFAPLTVTSNGLTAYSLRPFVPTFPSGRVIDSGSFAHIATIPTGEEPIAIASGDLDGDGRVDIVVANAGTDSVALYRNVTTGDSVTTIVLRDRLALYAGTSPYFLSVGDLTGDGKPDIIVAVNGENIVAVLENMSGPGSLSFRPRVQLQTGPNPYGVAIGDMTGDGKPDIVSANLSDGTVSMFQNRSVAGELNAGSFADARHFSVGMAPYRVAIADMDGDGIPDIVTANYSGEPFSSTLSVLRNRSTYLSISFDPARAFRAGPTPDGLAVGDVDGDGKMDVAVANRSTNAVSIIRNLSIPGSLAFAAHVELTCGGSPYGIGFGDLEGDGKIDLVSANAGAASISILKNISRGGEISEASFAPRVDIGVGSGPQHFVIADGDGDGQPDIAVVNTSGNSINILKNVVSPAPSAPKQLAVVDSSDASVSLNWKRSDEPHFGRYRVYGGTSSQPTAQLDSSGVQIEDTSRTVGGLRNDTRYYFRITVVNTAGAESPFSNEVNATPVDRTPPSAPLDLFVSDSSSTKLTIKWRKNVEPDILRYRVYRSTSLHPTTGVDSTADGGADTLKSFTGLTNGVRYHLRVTAVDSAGNESVFSNEVNAAPDATLSVDDSEVMIPNSYSLSQNYPNPFNPATTLRYGLPVRSHVVIDIFNVSGQRVARVADGEFKAGMNHVRWDAHVPSGLYLCRIQADPVDHSRPRFGAVRKLILLR